MKIHKEGSAILLFFAVFVIIINLISFYYIRSYHVINGIIFFASISFYGLILNFFREPYRIPIIDASKIIAPADGKVVVIEEVDENEYFHDKRLLVSIFMSVYDVHINWYPIAGIVKYMRHHHGKYLLAWHPKSSEENERTTIVVCDDSNREILFRQIAGFVARRVVCYAKEGEIIKQSSQVGFIKFGSRVDIYMPLGTKINVELNSKVVGSQTVVATFA